MPANDPMPIILLPGLDGTGEFLADLGNRLAERREVTAVAYPSNQHLGYAGLTDFVIARLPPGRFIILGESFSGPIAIEIAARLADRAAGLILVSTFAVYPLPPILRRLARRFDPSLIPRKLAATALMGRDATPELKADLARVLATLPRAIIRARFQDALTVDKRRRLADVRCPALIIRGQLDRLFGEKAALRLATGLAASRIEVIDAHHMLLQTHPAEAARLIENFCDELTEQL